MHHARSHTRQPRLPAWLLGVLLSILAVASQYSQAKGIDSQLVGLWRHTSGHYGGGFSMTTDTFYQLSPDGTFQTWSNTVGGGREVRSEREFGRWSTTNGRIFIQAADGESMSTAYSLTREGLYLPQEEHYRHWERVR